MKNLRRILRSFARPAPAAALLTLVTLGSALPSRAVEDAGMRSVFARGAGGRALSLGGAYVAVDGDPSAAIWNPAGLAGVERKGVYLTHTDLIGFGFSEQFAAFAMPSWRLGTFSLALRRFAVDGIEGRDSGGAVTDSDLSDAETELALGYGRELASGWRLGAAFKLQQQELAGYSAAGLGLDLGVQVNPLRVLGIESDLSRGWSLGLQLRNVIEPNLRLLEDDSTDPAGVRFGTALDRPLGEHLDLLAVADLEKTKSMDARLHAGLELDLMKLLALRVGSLDGMLTAGSGLAWRQFRVDYSFEDNPIETVHRMGLGVDFGASTGQQQQAELDREENRLQERLAYAFTQQSRDRERELLASAESALAASDPDRALGLIATLRVLAPEHEKLDGLESEAYRLLARGQEDEDNLTAATLNYGRALALDAGNREAETGLQRVRAESRRRHDRTEALRALFDQAMAAFTAGDLIDARARFQRLLEQNPGDEDARVMLDQVGQTLRIRAESLADRAVGLAESGRLDEARATLGEARLMDSGCPALAQAGRRIDEAEARQRRAAEQSRLAQRSTSQTNVATPSPVAAAPRPSFASLSADRQREIAELYRRGMEEAERGRRDNALRYWEMVWADAPDYQQVAGNLKTEYLARGMEAFAAGDLDRAIEFWEQTLEIDPDDPRARGYLARAREQRMRIREIRSTQG